MPSKGELYSESGWKIVPKRDKLGIDGGLWNVIDDVVLSTIETYRQEFLEVYDLNGLPDFLQTRENPLVIDAMSTPRPLRGLHQRMLRKNQRLPRSLVIGGSNYGSMPEDQDLGITYTSFDLAKIKNWLAIDEWREGKPISMFMERGLGGLCYVPTNQKYECSVLSFIWERLDDEGGMLLLLTPSTPTLQRRNIPIYEWLDVLNKQKFTYKFDRGTSSRSDPLAGHTVDCGCKKTLTIQYFLNSYKLHSNGESATMDLCKSLSICKFEPPRMMRRPLRRQISSIKLLFR